MTLAFYFFQRFFKYLFLINISLTFLFSFIEFFEKTLRVKTATTGTILHFISLNVIPAFFENLAIASWLATCFFIKELIQQNEWEIFQILSINKKKLFNLFLTAGIVLSIFSFLGKESFAFNLANKSDKFKQEKLKQSSLQKMINKWFILPEKETDNNLFCYFRSLDLENNVGEELILIQLTPSFEIEKIQSSPKFYIQPETNTLYLPSGTAITTQDNQQQKITHEKLQLPSFFSQLQLNIEIPSLKLIVQNLISTQNILPADMYNDLIAQLLRRILQHLLLIIYPLLTFCLFALFAYHQKYKWVAILLPYPIVTIMTTFFDFIVQKGISAWLIILPYIILTVFILLCNKNLEKTS